MPEITEVLNDIVMGRGQLEQFNPGPRGLCWRVDDWIYKEQPAHLTQNEIWCLKRMVGSDYVPEVEQVTSEILRIHYVERIKIQRPEVYMTHLPRVLQALQDAGIRHGDICDSNVIPHFEKPMLIDFAESRLLCDPRPDKREGSDAEALRYVMTHQCN